ncbi:ArnT family glycosyltransferase [Pseudaquabacterium terrae]|uniref:ArnT family glycosyltransferase n=1 Tax=Pseudaquabacterium terrae TaxID=2732868 RepID=UPI001FE49812|nr:glycosyltransferase family 39 protein [Aquabacterium terrae]
MSAARGGPLSWWPAEALGVLAAIVAWLGAGAGLRALALPDEGRYVGVALEMLQSGDWLTPRLDGLPFFHKPPLFYWLTAAALALLGQHEWAARAASLLGASALAAGLYLYLRRWAGAALARASLLALLTQPMYFIGAQFANCDMLVAACIGLALLAWAHALQSAAAGSGQAPRPARAAGFALAALGVLAKGLIGIVLPLLVLLAWLACQRRLAQARLLAWWPGWLLFAAIAAPWFVLVELRHPGFADYFFVGQQLHRYARGGFNNVQPAWFYPAVLALLCLPWWPWLWGVRRAAGAAPGAAPWSLMGCWLLVVLVFFSVPRSKLIGYMLPLLAPLAVLVAAAGLAWAARSRRAALAWRASAGLGVTLCLGALLLLLVRQPGSTQPLALALAAQRAAGEPVLFVDGLFYDLRFYAPLPRSVAVVQDWHDPALATFDNWRRELSDAAAFAPSAGAAVLLERNRFAPRLCQHRISWIVAPPDAARRAPFLAHARPVAQAQRAGLWRVDSGDAATRAALQCPGTPSDAPADR